MSEEQIPVNAPEIEKEQIQLLVEDDSAQRAQKAWLILGGQGPVNPVFEKIFEAYWHMDKQAWADSATAGEVPSEAKLMAG